MQEEKERILYQGRPFWIVNIKEFSIYSLILIFSMVAPSLWQNYFSHMFANRALYILISKALFFIAIFCILKTWLKNRHHKYEITNERFIETTGIFSKTTNELELFRVKDMTYLEPFLARMFSCAHIVMDTSDKSTPVVAIRYIKNAKACKDLLRTNIANMRTRRGVREVDL